MPRCYIVDFMHLAPTLETDASHLKAARTLARYFATIIETATALDYPEIPVNTAMRCHCRPGHKPCSGYLCMLLFENADKLHFECPQCGENGQIENFAGTRFNLSGRNEEELPGALAITLHPEEYRAIESIDTFDANMLATLRCASVHEATIVISASVSRLRLLASHIVSACPTLRAAKRNHLIAVLGRIVEALADACSDVDLT